MEEQDARQFIERVGALRQEGASVVGRSLPGDREMTMLRERLLDRKTLKAIGEAHDIGNERVRQILNHYFGVHGIPPHHEGPEEVGERRRRDVQIQRGGRITTTIPADVVLILRGALYVGLARAAGDIGDECSLESPGDMIDVLAQFDRIRALLDAIGWEKKPQQQPDVELDRTVHGQALIETLEDDRESWDWLSYQETTESPEGRERAAANAAVIERFLGELDARF
jgi:hypothetical protein